jgi:hypothetical protein
VTAARAGPPPPTRSSRLERSPAGNEPSAQELLDEVEKVHRQFDDGLIDFETYEDKKTLLLSQLPVD